MPTLTRLLRLLSPFRWWIALAVLLSFGVLGASVGLMAMSAYLISKAALVTAFADLAIAVTAVRAFAIARAALRYAERYVTHLTAFGVLTRLRVWFYTVVEPLAPARLQAYRSGDVLARIIADIDTLQQFYVRAVVPPLAAALVVALSFAILGAFDTQLGLVLLAFLLLTGIVLPLATRRLSQRPAGQFVATRARLHAALTEDLQGIADVLAFGQEQDCRRRALLLSRELEHAQLRLATLRGISNALAMLLAGLAGVSVLTLAIPLVSGGRIEGVFLALLPLTAIASFEAVQPLGSAWQQLEASKVAAGRLFEVADAPPPVRDPGSPLPLPADLTVAFRDVGFAYAASEPRVLDGVTLEVPAGTCLAVTGSSGAGKSTLVNLLARFWDVQTGSVCIGGRDVRALGADDVRSVLGVVTQQVHLFNATVRDNLLLARGDATDDEVVAACRLAQIHAFVAALPQGYDTLIGENGVKLSSGERQRLAIARVILKDAPIVILDEATANLDALTEQAVMRALEPWLRSRTTVLISHRRAGFEYADQVVVLEHGQVVALREQHESATGINGSSASCCLPPHSACADLDRGRLETEKQDYAADSTQAQPDTVR